MGSKTSVSWEAGEAKSVKLLQVKVIVNNSIAAFYMFKNLSSLKNIDLQSSPQFLLALDLSQGFTNGEKIFKD